MYTAPETQAPKKTKCVFDRLTVQPVYELSTTELLKIYIEPLFLLVFHMKNENLLDLISLIRFI